MMITIGPIISAHKKIARLYGSPTPKSKVSIAEMIGTKLKKIILYKRFSFFDIISPPW